MDSDKHHAFNKLFSNLNLFNEKRQGNGLGVGLQKWREVKLGNNLGVRIDNPF